MLVFYIQGGTWRGIIWHEHNAIRAEWPVPVLPTCSGPTQSNGASVHNPTYHAEKVIYLKYLHSDPSPSAPHPQTNSSPTPLLTLQRTLNPCPLSQVLVIHPVHIRQWMDKEDGHMDACIAWTPTNRQQLPLPILDLHPELRAFPSTPTPCFTVSFSFFSPFSAKIIILSLSSSGTRVWSSTCWEWANASHGMLLILLWMLVSQPVVWCSNKFCVYITSTAFFPSHVTKSELLNHSSNLFHNMFFPYFYHHETKHYNQM